MAEGNITAIKTFFEEGKLGRKVELDEFKALNEEEMTELGAMCKAAIAGVIND